MNVAANAHVGDWQPTSCVLGACNTSLPNGLGLSNGPGGPVTGVPPNELTNSDRRGRLAGTPWHKHVPARIEPITPSEPRPDERPPREQRQ